MASHDDRHIRATIACSPGGGDSGLVGGQFHIRLLVRTAQAARQSFQNAHARLGVVDRDLRTNASAARICGGGAGVRSGRVTNKTPNLAKKNAVA